jgi:ferrous iron transport protein A
VKTLEQLAVGCRARVEAIQGTDEIAIRLLEMGLTPGTDLMVVGTAPMGDPVELEVRGYRLSVRKSEASRVEIVPA